MPIYEFDCSACGHGFERLQKLSDADPADCPACGRPAVKRRLSAPSFRLAGSGWYETDFKGDKDKKRNLAGKEEAPKSDAGSGSDKGGSADKPAASTSTASTATTAVTA